MGITIACRVPGQPAVSYRISTFDRSGKPRSTRHGQAMSWDNNSKRPESKTCSSWVSLLPDGHVLPHNFSISSFLPLPRLPRPGRGRADSDRKWQEQAKEVGSATAPSSELSEWHSRLPSTGSCVRRW